MAKKWLAWASGAVLSGLVVAVSAAGCAPESSNKSNISSPPDPTDGGPTEADDAAAEGDGEAPPTQPAAECMVKEPIDTSGYPYKSPRVEKGACTTGELEDLTQYFEDHAREGFAVPAWKAVVSETCADCVFSDGSGPTWTPILTKDDKLDTIDRGGCIEAVSGNEACGRAYQNVNECLVEACYTNCQTAEEYFQCIDNTPAVFTGPCKAAFDEMETSCGSDLQEYEKLCESDKFNFQAPIRVMCIDGGRPAG